MEQFICLYVFFLNNPIYQLKPGAGLALPFFQELSFSSCGDAGLPKDSWASCRKWKEGIMNVCWNLEKQCPRTEQDLYKVLGDHRIVESLRLEKIFKILESNLLLNPTLATKPHHKIHLKAHRQTPRTSVDLCLKTVTQFINSTAP